MEDGLVLHIKENPKKAGSFVLILVVMEDGLVRNTLYSLFLHCWS